MVNLRDKYLNQGKYIIINDKNKKSEMMHEGLEGKFRVSCGVPRIQTNRSQNELLVRTKVKLIRKVARGYTDDLSCLPDVCTYS